MLHLLTAGIGFGVVAGAILSISAIGFSLQFGMTNILNLAYGTIMMCAAFAAYAVASQGVSIWLGALAGIATGAVLSMGLGHVIFRPFARRGARVFEMAMVTVAVALVGDYTVASATRSQIFQFTFPAGAQYHLGGAVITTTDLIIVAIAIAVIIALEMALHWTRLGVAIRATSANAPLARASGIHTVNVVNLTWLLSGGLCGLGGVTLALSYQSITFSTGTTYLPYIFAVVIVAGIGSIGYAAVASLVLSLVVQIAGAFGASSYNIVIALAVLLAMLLIRPQGVFGRLFEKEEIAA